MMVLEFHFCGQYFVAGFISENAGLDFEMFGIMISCLVRSFYGFSGVLVPSYDAGPVVPYKTEAATEPVHDALISKVHDALISKVHDALISKVLRRPRHNDLRTTRPQVLPAEPAHAIRNTVTLSVSEQG